MLHHSLVAHNKERVAGGGVCRRRRLFGFQDSLCFLLAAELGEYQSHPQPFKPLPPGSLDGLANGLLPITGRVPLGRCQLQRSQTSRQTSRRHQEGCTAISQRRA